MPEACQYPNMATTRETDAQLVARCRAGDEEAWRELVDRFSRYVYAIAVQGFRLRSADAEDVFQEVFARAYERLDDLRDDEAIEPWLAQLTRRLCIDSHPRRAPASSPPKRKPATDGRRHAGAPRRGAWPCTRRSRDLPEHCQEILDRFFARDESYRTIGEALRDSRRARSPAASPAAS